MKKNKAVAALMQHIKDRGEIPKDWVSREDYFACKDGTDWRAGILQTCWSFGNNPRKGYLFGKNIESLKKLGHDIVVNGCKAALAALNDELGTSILMPKTRLDLRKAILAEGKRFDLQQLEQLQQLQQLERLEQLERLHIYSSDYQAIELCGGVIYCDPPYKKAAQYKEGFDHDRFYKWCDSVKLPLFVSEYELPMGFEVVAEFEHRSTLSATKNDKKTVEKLFWNGITDYKGGRK